MNSKPTSETMRAIRAIPSKKRAAASRQSLAKARAAGKIGHRKAIVYRLTAPVHTQTIATDGGWEDDGDLRIGTLIKLIHRTHVDQEMWTFFSSSLDDGKSWFIERTSVTPGKILKEVAPMK